MEPTDEDAPALSGSVHLSDNGFVSAVVYKWPIDLDNKELLLVLKQRDDGELTAKIATLSST